MDSRDRRRSQRAAARAAIQHDAASGTYLRTRSIADATKSTYHDAFWSFVDFATKGGHVRSTYSGHSRRGPRALLRQALL